MTPFSEIPTSSTRISIVIPAFNAEKYLVETVESVLAQTVQDWELIIVDDGSLDATPNIADNLALRDPRICVHHQSNQGLPGARNAGYRKTSPDSPYVIFLDADDIWETVALAKLRSALEEQPGAVAAHAVARFINEQSQPYRSGSLERAVQHRKAVVNGQVITCPLNESTTFSVLAINCCIVTAGMVLLRRTALEAVSRTSPPFDSMPGLPRASLEDWDLWLRLAQHGEFAVVGETLLNYRSHASNLSQQKWLMFLGELYVRQKAAALPGLTADQSQILARGTQYWLATHARRLAALLIGSVHHRWRQGQFRSAAQHVWLAAREYLNYLHLRRSKTHLSPDQVQRILGSNSFLCAAAAVFEGDDLA